MCGAFYRASSKTEGHLPFGRNRLVKRVSGGDGRAIERHALTATFATKELGRRFIVLGRIFFGENGRVWINAIEIAGVRSQPNDADAAHQQHDDEQRNGTAQHAAT